MATGEEFWQSKKFGIVEDFFFSHPNMDDNNSSVPKQLSTYPMDGNMVQSTSLPLLIGRQQDPSWTIPLIFRLRCLKIFFFPQIHTGFVSRSTDLRILQRLNTWTFAEPTISCKHLALKQGHIALYLSCSIANCGEHSHWLLSSLQASLLEFHPRQMKPESWFSLCRPQSHIHWGQDSLRPWPLRGWLKQTMGSLKV